MGEKANKALFWGGQVVAAAGTAGQVAAEVTAHPKLVFASGMVAFTGSLALTIGARLREAAAAAKVLADRDRATRAMVGLLAQKSFVAPSARTPGAVPAFRVTALVPDATDELLRPRWRAYYREEVVPATSRVVFARGDPLAGSAWVASEEDRMQLRDDLPSLADVGSDVSEWRSRWTRAGVAGRVIESMGHDCSRGWRYMEHVRSILCFRVHLGSAVVVLAVDSVFRNAFEQSRIRTVKSIGEAMLLVEHLGQSIIA